MVYLMMLSVVLMIWHLMVRRLLATFKFCYITVLSAASLHSIGHRMINEYGAVGGMRTARKTQITQSKPAPVPYRPL
jgi:hypothetical protein